MEQSKEYYAFISYKREDIKEAKRLQHALEYYRLPNQLRQEQPELPEYVRPVFRDMTDLEVGELSAQIHLALEQSHYLIVICSPRAAASKWVNDEVKYFITLGKQEKIIPYIIEGVPHAENEKEECFPPSLLELSKEKELLGANINEVGKDSATIRVISRMFNIRFDTLFQRYVRERKRKLLTFIVSIVTIAMVSIFVSLWIGWLNKKIQNQNTLIVEQNKSLLIEQSRYVAKEVEGLMLQGDYELATIIAREILPSELRNPQRPYTVEAERALRNSMNKGRISKGFTQANVFNLHEDMIYSAQYSSDGKTVLTASQDGQVKICDLVYNKELFSAEIKGIKEAIFSPSQEKILLRFFDKIALYNIESKRVEKELEISQCLTFCYNKKGSLIAAASWNKIILLDEDLNIIRTLSGHDMRIQSLDFSYDDRLLASASGSIFNSIDNTVKVWELAEGKNIKTFVGHTDAVSCVRFSPDNIHLASASCDNTIIVWDLINERREGQLSGHTKFINHVEYNPMGTELVSCSYDNTIVIWDARQFKNIQTINCECWSDFVHYDINGTGIVAGLWNNLVVWDKGAGNNVLCHDLGAMIDNIVYSPDGNRIAVQLENRVKILDALTHEIECEIKTNNMKEFTSVQFHSNNSHIVYVDDADNFEIVSIKHPDDRTFIKSEYVVDEFVVNKSGIIYAATYDNDSNIRLEGWNTDTGTRTFSIVSGITTAVNHLALDDKDSLLAVSCGVMSDEENFIMLWDLESMKCIRNFEGHLEGVSCSTFSKEGERLFSASQDHTVRCWNVDDGSEIYRHRLNDMVSVVTTSYDGELFAASSQMGEIVIGQIKSGKFIETFFTDSQSNSIISFSPNSNCLAVGFETLLCNKDILPLNDLLDMANKIPRELVQEEREKYYLSE